MEKQPSVHKKQKCPICKKPAISESYPFCSPGCKNIDLHRWLTNAYVLPGRDGEAIDVIETDVIETDDPTTQHE